LLREPRGDPPATGLVARDDLYHTTVSAGGDVALAREFETGRVPVGLSANLSANLNATGDLGLFIPSYVFATPFLGGQASVSAIGIYGRTPTSLAGTLSGARSEERRGGKGFRRGGRV